MLDFPHIRVANSNGKSANAPDIGHGFDVVFVGAFCGL